MAGFVLGSRVGGNAGSIERIQRSSTHYFQRPDAEHLSYEADRTSLFGTAASLRFAVRAARSGLRDRLASGLEELERLYLDELMQTRDAVEGLQSFLEKRPPAWSDA